MTPSEISKTIELCLQTKRPIFQSGPPGVGKSAVVMDVARRHGLPLIDLRLSQLDSVDMRGLPMIVKLIRDGKVTDQASSTISTGGSEYETRWIPPSFLPKGGKGILFLDELNTALPAVQVVAYQLTHDRRVGDYVLPDDWLVVAAGNRQSDRAVVNRMSSALASRFLMVNYECNVNDWSAWAIRNKIEPEIVSCVRAQPQLLFNFDPAKWQDGTTFACPRTWDYLDQTIKACPDVFGLGKSKNNTANDAANSLRCWELELVQGIIGPAAGMAFFLHLKHYLDLPTTAEILKDPAGCRVPDNASGMHAVSAALMRAVDSKTFGPIVQYLSRMPRDFLYYVARAAIDPAQGGNTALSSTKAWKDFVTANGDLFGFGEVN